jgi:uncharacterized membrane protein YraQ (UPF0718 family)|uniref:Permease n=1 Tax=Thermomicrobium roseum TaxID=500 RepID=A0A7C1K4V3_THERO
MSGAFPRQPSAVVQRSLIEFGLALAAFFGSVLLILATVVDMRRAFLLDPTSYQKLGSPSAFLYYTPWHFGVLVLALLVSWLTFRLLRAAETGLTVTELRRARTVLAVLLMSALIIDLFVYRIVQAERVAAAGQAGIAKTFAVDALPSWLRPFGEAINFLLVVWHATILGILLGALFVVLLCTSQKLKRLLSLTGLRAHFAGSVSALAFPFCSCCAGPIGASLYRGGASLNASLAFVVAAPLLNVTTLFLAATLLPTDFALLRIGGGVLLAVFGTWLVTVAVGRRPPVVVGETGYRGLRWLESLMHLFSFERYVQQRRIETPSELVSAWLAMAWIIGRIAVPMLLIAATVVGWAVPILTALGGGNTPATVLFAVLVGVLLMVPTWTELGIAASLIQQGLTGLAAALLLALPAVSLPSLLIYGAALRDWRVPALMAVVVAAVSVVAGLLLL